MSCSRILVGCAGVFTLFHLISSPVFAAAGDEHWDRAFGWPGTTNWVYSLAVHQNNLIAGGYNPTASSTNSSIDAWDGNRWSSLGAINSSLIVFDFASIGNTLYVGGVFSAVNGVSASGLARWNGSTWSDVGGFRGAVFSLATDGVNLYVGGAFTNAGGLLTTNVARWDGSTWAALGHGLGPYDENGNVVVRDLAWTGSELFACGSFTSSGPAMVTGVARWNGNSWATLGEGIPTGRVSALAWKGTDLYVGGLFSAAGPVAAANIARWNGSQWIPLGSGLNNEVTSLAVRGNELFVGGVFTNAGGVTARGIARWDGEHWSAFGVLNDVVQKLLVEGTNLYVGGLFTQVDDLLLNHLGRWDGSNWHPVGSGNGLSFFGNKVAAGTNGIYAGGFFTGAGTVAASRIARWDGTKWIALGSGLKGTDAGSGTLPSALAPFKSQLYVGGAFTNAGGVTASNIAMWDGRFNTWSGVAGGVNGTVLALDLFGSTVYAGGTFTHAGGLLVNRIAYTDGISWSPVGVGGVNSNVNAIVATSGTGDAYIAGRFTLAAGFIQVNRVARWAAGGGWTSLGTGTENGVNGPVTAMIVNGSDVYVAGSFTMAGSVSANRIAKWDGLQWSALGAGLTGGGGTITVNDMVSNGPYLYVCGNFTTAGGGSAPAIARWDGTNWFSLGSGLSTSPGSPTATSLTVMNNDVYVSGRFIGAGSKDAHYIAHWNDQIDFDFVPSLRLSNPQRSGGLFIFRLTADGIPRYVIETTTSFSSWTPLRTNTVTPYDFIDVNASGSRRFYRARPAP